jgi:SAM-dependent methyltransferase
LRLTRKPRGISAFLDTLPRGARLLDVGCGNGSPARVRRARPDLDYTGLDIGDAAPAKGLLTVAPDDFATAIEGFEGRLDGVLSSHNLEHCWQPDAVLRAMCRALKPGGWLYLAFPSAASVDFPRRAGSLNFFDDATHVRVPDHDGVRRTLAEEGLRVEFAAPRYRPPLHALLGLALEPLSWWQRRTLPGTWQLYGFETVIWASRPPHAAR